MATKINTSYYGDIATFVDVSNTNSKVKRSNYNVWNLIDAGKYTGGSFDVSAAPWGVGRSAAASMFRYIACKDGVLFKPITVCNLKSNTPLYLYDHAGVNDDSGYDSSGYVVGSSVDSWKWEDMLYRTRANLTTAANSNELISTINSADNVNDANLAINYPVVYADYQILRLAVTAVMYKPVGENFFRPCTMADLKNNTVNAEYIIGFVGQLYSSETETALGFHPTVGGGEIEIPDEFKDVYYTTNTDAITQPFRTIRTFGWWSLRDFTQNAILIWTNSSYFTEYSDFNTLNNSWFIGANSLSGWSSVTSAQQVFDDVAYHYNYGITSFVSNYDNIAAWAENHAISGDDAPSSFCMLDIDEHSYNSKSEAFYYAILHELAFIGFPVVDSVANVSADIGDDEVYLPEFAYMVSTGRFKNGTDSLDMINAAWGDIFDDSMPVYDPTIDPDDPPEPGEEDQGDLSNSYPNRYSNAGGLAQWVVSYTGVEDLAAFLNGSYLPTAADLDADFKGTNPQDYVVSVQKYPFTLPIQGSSVPTDIYIGKINSGIKAKKLYDDIFVHAVNSQVTFDFGAIEIPVYYGDFRDYQSKILLFMPFIGTDELDPKLYIGTTLSLIYKVDFNTGSVAAEIKRNGLTMETKTGNISITIPFMAANMGQYQNQIAQLSYAKDLTKIKGIGTALSAGFTMAAGAQATMSTGQPSLAAGSNLAQAGVQLAANATQLSQLDYQIEHIAPSVGTISTAAAANAFFLDDRARLIIIRPKTLAGFDSAAYAHTVGHACCIAGKLSDFSGYTIAAAAELSNITTKSAHYAATEQELELIKKALQAGVYL